MEPVHRVETLISQPSLKNNDLDEERECDYDEEEDVDFNPFLKGTPSREPSSSLSSEVEAIIDGEIVSSISVVQGRDNGDKGREEEIAIPERLNSNSDSGSQKEGGFVGEKTGEQLCDMIQTQKPVLMMSPDEEDDAICKRTRARYSLESFTLDDLEAFLQETDDEDDIPNVDDEEEYRKFLAAVLHSGDAEVQVVPSGNNDDDDDEDNDLDFEIELEEALETDDEESIPEKITTDDNKSTKRRPVTRQKRRQNIPIQHKINSSGQAGRLLRPLVPLLPIAQPARRFSATEAVASSSEDCPINAFSQSQMGELHCLIQDHLQLLIQVYSLCALDHSRQNVGTQVQGLISEMIQRHEENVSRPSHLLFTGSASSVLGVVDLAGEYLVDVSSGMLLC